MAIVVGVAVMKVETTTKKKKTINNIRFLQVESHFPGMASNAFKCNDVRFIVFSNGSPTQEQLVKI